MAKLDKKNRIYVTKKMLAKTKLDFERPIYLFIRTVKCFYLANASEKNRFVPNLGRVKLNMEEHRIYLSRWIKSILDVDSTTNFALYVSNGVLYIEKCTPKRKLY